MAKNTSETTVKRLSDGFYMSVPTYTLDAVLKQGFVVEDEVKITKSDLFVCPICSSESKTKDGLNKHLNENPLHRQAQESS